MRPRFALAIAACGLLLTGCASAQASAPAAKPASAKLGAFFAEKHPECTIVTSAVGDVTDDGVEDMVVVFRDADGSMRTLVVIGGDTPAETNAVPAPAEDQRISFRDIDKKGPVEFIVRGSKGSDIGFAIYRVEGTTLTDLFGDNMDRCCDSGALWQTSAHLGTSRLG
ncbi:MAG: hypothetical protein CVT59_10800 [Actinobacteria bacterium HGW-Actinobacteria-1]|jgi:hypothetical protein|nr:MAG: hypothetical protein CVT59_10800 [Actinobacteria bacterium HGW-Actinobacteria-1]